MGGTPIHHDTRPSAVAIKLAEEPVFNSFHSLTSDRVELAASTECHHCVWQVSLLGTGPLQFKPLAAERLLKLRQLCRLVADGVR